VDDLRRYLDGLHRSWEALCSNDRGRVERTDGVLAAVSPYPFLNNGVLLRPSSLPGLCELYRGVSSFAVWTAEGDREAEAVLRQTGLVPDVTTRPMVCGRDALPASVADPEVEADVAPARVAALNGVPAQALEEVEGLRCFATTGDDCALVLQDAGDDVVMSFVATRPSARGRGLATRLVRAALADARQRGAAGVVLQATPQAERIYRRLGFASVGGWQEWTPAPGSAVAPSGGAERAAG
jgi:ribosomal protein S18 acetylase RimI-like enzyme